MADKQIVTQPDHGEPIVEQDGSATPRMQAHLDDITQRLNENSLGLAVWLPKYAKADLPASSALPDATEAWMVYVTNESGGAVPAFWDGTNWRRVTDRAIVS